MEKYGPKRRFLIDKDATNASGDGDGVPVDPVGFVVKFRLSHAYRALEKQEVEAAVPDIKPVRKRKRTKFLLPDDKKVHPGEKVVPAAGGGGGVVVESCGRPSSGASTTREGSAQRRVQIRIRSTTSEKENGTGSLWQTLTKQKASSAVMKKEQQEREDRQKELKSGKTGKGSNNNNNQKQSNSKQTQGVKGKGGDPKQPPGGGKQGTPGGKQGRLILRGQNTRTKTDLSQDRKAAIERSLIQLRADTKQLQNRKCKELWDSHFQGIGGMGLPGSIGAATTEYGASSFADLDSMYRMFSDSGSITMDAITISNSRPSSPSKSLIDASSRPSSSGRQGRAKSPKPRTSTPAARRSRSPSRSRPSTGKTKTPAANVSTSRRAQSAKTPSGKSPNESAITTGKGKSRSISAILRGGEGKSGGKVGPEGKEGAENKVLAPRKISKYLYHMCNCQHVARKDTLAKLFKKKTVSRVIGIQCFVL